MDPLENLLSRLTHVRKSGKGHTACCPAHQDKSPSLSITSIPDGRILIHCHAGCPPLDVLAAVGMEMGDLFPDGALNDHLYGATPWLHKQRNARVDQIQKDRRTLEMAQRMRETGEKLTTADKHFEQRAYQRMMQNVGEL